MTNYKISQEDVLKVLTSKPQSVAEIARKTGVFKGTPKKHLLRLEAQGLATKTDEGWIKTKDVHKVAQPKVTVCKVMSSQLSDAKSLNTSKHILAVKDDTDIRILNAALKIFSSKGYSGATTREIAHEANVNEVTIFRKFQSKENLLKEVMSKNKPTCSKLDNLIQFEKDVDLKKSLFDLGKKILTVKKNNKEDTKFHMLMSMLVKEGQTRPEITEILLSVFEMNLTRLSEYFEFQIKNGKMRNIDPRTASITFLSYFIYAAITRRIFGLSFLSGSDEEIERFIDIFTKGTLKVEDLKTR